jgi:glucose/arabinose dehydrogenase
VLRRFVRILAVLLLVGMTLPRPLARAQEPTSLLTLALQEQLQVNTILGNAALGGSAAAMRDAVRQMTPHAQSALASVEAAQAGVDGPAQQFIQLAAAELRSTQQLGELILTGPDDAVGPRLEELRARGGAALAATNLALFNLGAGPGAPSARRLLQAADLRLPLGYQAEIVAHGLGFLTAVVVAPDGTPYVAEAGFAHGSVPTQPRVLRVERDGSTTPVAEQLTGPVAGLAIQGRTLFVSHRGTITAVDLPSGHARDIVTELPSQGDHYNESIAVGPDGKLYFTQGSATNSGVVGLDNYLRGWLRTTPRVHDVPCRDLALAGVNYTTGNPLTDDAADTATTGAYLPFGTPSTPGQVVRGQVKCSGAILRVNPDGSDLEVYADGFRNPHGLAFRVDGQLYVTENGPAPRGSRPVDGPDNLYEVVPGGWYGWPDFYGGLPADSPGRKPEVGEVPRSVLLNPPPLAGPPLAQFEPGAAAAGFALSRNVAFAPLAQAFVALLGDLAAPTVGSPDERAGHEVVVVTPEGVVRTFLTSASDSQGSPLLRPSDATFDPSGRALYVTHFGAIQGVPGGVVLTPGTGALIRVTRTPPPPAPIVPDGPAPIPRIPLGVGEGVPAREWPTGRPITRSGPPAFPPIPLDPWWWWCWPGIC